MNQVQNKKKMKKRVTMRKAASIKMMRHLGSKRRLRRKRMRMDRGVKKVKKRAQNLSMKETSSSQTVDPIFKSRRRRTRLPRVGLTKLRSSTKRVVLLPKLMRRSTSKELKATLSSNLLKSTRPKCPCSNQSSKSFRKLAKTKQRLTWYSITFWRHLWTKLKRPSLPLTKPTT